MPLIWPLRVHLSLDNPIDRRIYEHLQTIPKGQRANFVRQVLATACGEESGSVDISLPQQEFPLPQLLSSPPAGQPSPARPTLTF